MAATWVSKIGCGTMLARCQMISMSWRAAWKTFSTFSLPISSNDGFLRACQLHDAEQRIVGGLAQELGVDGDDGVPFQARTDSREFRSGSDEIHERPMTSAHFPKFVLNCRATVHELRKVMGTSKTMIRVPLSISN